MAKLKAPLLSIGASGQIGKAMVTASWRGIAYARQHVVPANPRTAGQVTTRNTFSSADNQFKHMLTIAQSPWLTFSKGKPLTERNAFIQSFVKNLRGDATMADYVASPGAYGGLAGSNLVAADGAAGEIDVSLNVEQNPVDWVPTYVNFTLFPDRDPATLIATFVTEAQEAGPAVPYVPPQTITHSFTGLTTATDYVCSAWILWTRADGVIAPGPSATTIHTAP
jgi:hypothetical protein